MIQIAPDRHSDVHKTTSKLYRDSEGRERCEESSADGAYKAVFIWDPVEDASYSIDPDRKVAVRSVGRPEYVARELQGSTMRFTPGTLTQLPAVTRGARSIGPANVQQLGTRVLDGLEVLGTRTTVESGNKQPISVSERWFAPDLHVTVIMTNTLALGGTIVYKLTNIARGEQPRALFEVPPRYTVQSAYRVKTVEIDRRSQ